MASWATAVDAATLSSDFAWDRTYRDGQPIVDAIVTAMGPQGIQTTDTGRNGQFVFRGLTPGVYKVKAEAPTVNLLKPAADAVIDADEVDETPIAIRRRNDSG